jgi:predicted phage tail protein
MANTLQSRAFAQVLDLISEGEIVGLVDGAKSIYLNGTVLENADGSRNFQNVTYEGRTGTQAQTYIPSAADVESAIVVSTEVTAATPLVRTVSNSDVDAGRLILSVLALYKAESDGKQAGTSVEIAIDVQASGGSYVTQVTDVIDGKATSKYQRAYRIALTGSAPWNIRVRRITADTTDLTLQNKTYWDSYTEIIEAKLRYPNSALVSMRFDSAAFQGIPSRAFDMKLLKVQVPVNYDPVARTYTGIWDGTFKTAWTDNPAWVFYDLVTNERYGLGTYVPAAQVDKWALYTVSQYCDEQVNDGFGGTEPRFTCNVYLQSRQEAFKVINDLASVFRGMVYWSSGSLTVSQDAPQDAVALYTQANVVNGQFTYSGASAKAKHTVALVTWNDPDDQYRQKIEYVENATQIARLGVIQTEVTAFGCTSRGQANRVGRWLLFSEELESETVTFSTGIEGAVARPGDVIKVADSARAGARMGGRVVTASTTVIGVDSAVTLAAGTWTMYVVLADGTVESKTVSSVAGQSVTLASALSSAPQVGAQWVITGTSLEAQTFRVVTVSEQDGGVVEITALKHDPDKYNAVEDGLVITPRDISILDDATAPVTNGAVTEYLYTTTTDVKVGATITWTPPSRATGYLVEVRIDQQNLVQYTTQSASLELLDCEVGTYIITIYALNITGKKSAAYTFTASVLGKTANPANVTGLQLVAQGANGLLQWDQHPDLDVRIGGQIAIRYSELTTSATWNTSIPVAEFAGSATSGTVPLAAGTYLAKAVDSTGQNSLGTATVLSQTLSIIQYNAVVTSDQDPGFTGTKTNMFVESNKLKLDLVPTPSLDLDFTAGTYEEGEVYPDPTVQSGQYEFSSYIDVGAIYTSRVSVNFAAVAVNLANLVDNWPTIDSIGDIDLGDIPVNYVDSWTDWDAVLNFDGEQELGDASISFQIATTNDDPAGTPTWSAWRTFYLGDYTARAFKFRLLVDRGTDPYTQVEVSDLGVTIDVPDRIESANNVSVTTSGLSVTFANQFYSTPAIAVTPYNMATGDYIVMSAQSSTGFTVTFKNSAGTNVARTMDWIAKGYGFKTT